MFMKMFFLDDLHVIIFAHIRAQAQTQIWPNKKGWMFGLRSMHFSNLSLFFFNYLKRSAYLVCTPKTRHVFPTKSKTKSRSNSKMFKCVDNFHTILDGPKTGTTCRIELNSFAAEWKLAVCLGSNTCH